MVARLIIEANTAPLRGAVPLPGDQELLIARMSLAVLSRGTSKFDFSGEQSGLAALLKLLSHLGVRAGFDGERVEVEGGGLSGISAPQQVLDLRGECQVAAIALALLACQPFTSELLVDQMVSDLLVEPLGGVVGFRVIPLGDSEGGARVSILASPDGQRPAGIEAQTHGVFPWVKQALLLFALRGASATALSERVASADYLERAMIRSRVPLICEGTQMALHPPRDEDALSPQTYEAVGSQRLLAPLIAAGLMVPHSTISIKQVGLNPSGSSAISLARHLGAEVGVSPRGDRQGEPWGDVAVVARGLRGLDLGGETIVRLGDGVFPFLASVARSSGTTKLCDIVPQARGADGRIVPRCVALLRQAGVEAETTEEGLRVVGSGGAPLRPLTVTTGGDSRLALLGTCLALGAAGQSVIDDVECLRADFPRWVGTLRALGASISVEDS